MILNDHCLSFTWRMNRLSRLRQRLLEVDQLLVWSTDSCILLNYCFYYFVDTKAIITATTSSIKGLSVDWISGNLFWTDFTNREIKVFNLDGSVSANLISHGLKRPRDIVVDPMKGWVYFPFLMC